VEADVIRPIEDAVNAIGGLSTLQSVAQSGRATITLTFVLGESSLDKAQEVRDKLDPVRSGFPAAVDDPQVLRFSLDSSPIMSLAVRSDSMADRDLTALAKDVIAKRIANIPGVGSATVVGGTPRQLNIKIDPERLLAFNISANAVITALRSANRDLAAGSVTSGTRFQSIQVLGRIEEAQAFGDIIVGTAGSAPIYLSDVATIEDGGGEATSLAILNGERALAIDVVKTQGANTVDVAHGIRETVESLRHTEFAGDDLDIEIVADNAESIEQSFHAVQNMLVEGAILAVVIVYLFLNSWRSTIITGLTLPISIIGTMIA
jgi:hydrophobic/amphiphilic exporter-1 (mainly G- bacteria), HAE1 family